MEERLAVVKVFCCYTPAHEVLFRDYFRKSLPAGFDLRATSLAIEGSGDFRSPEYLNCLERKLELIVASIRENPGEILVWSDVDILFLQPAAALLAELLETSGQEILFQREGPKVSHVNPGFVALRATPRVADFYGRVLAALRAGSQKNDQFIINPMLSAEKDLAWGYLPMTFYARTHGWPPPADIVIYHANETPGADGVGQKIGQFEHLLWVRKYGLFALALSCLRHVPKRLRRMLAR